MTAMTLDTLVHAVNSSGIPFIKNRWKKPPALPWGIVRQTGTENLSADNRVHVQCRRCMVELYAAEKDPKAEALVEQALDQACLFWDCTEAWIDSERMYVVWYEVFI